MNKNILITFIILFANLKTYGQNFDSLKCNIVVRGDFNNSDRYHLLFRSFNSSNTRKGIVFGSNKGFCYYNFCINDSNLVSKVHFYYSLTLYKKDFWGRMHEISEFNLPADSNYNVMLINKTNDPKANLFPFEIKWIKYESYIAMLISDINTIEEIVFESKR